MIESENVDLQLILATQSANYIVAEDLAPMEMPMIAREAFGEDIAPLDIDFIKACQAKDISIASSESDKHIGNVAEFLAPRFVARSKKTNELRAVFARIYDIVNDVVRKQQADILECKNDTERKLELLRNTTPHEHEPHLDWGEHAGLDIQLHATLDEVKDTWKTRAAGILRNLCSDNLTKKIQVATQSLQIPIWQQVVKGDGLQRIETELDNFFICTNDAGTANLNEDYAVGVPTVNRNCGDDEPEFSLALTRLSIALIHLACCKAEKDRNFKFCAAQRTFVLETETSLDSFSVPSTPLSGRSLLSQTSYRAPPALSRTAGRAAGKAQSPSTLTEDVNLALDWNKEQRHEIYGKALDAGTIEVPGRAEWIPRTCFNWFRTGNCVKGKQCTFKHIRPDSLDLLNRRVPICSHVDNVENPCATTLCQFIHYTEEVVATRLAEAEQRNGSHKRPRPDEEDPENQKRRLNESWGH
jgi:hypothetical protein